MKAESILQQVVERQRVRQTLHVAFNGFARRDFGSHRFKSFLVEAEKICMIRSSTVLRAIKVVT